MPSQASEKLLRRLRAPPRRFSLLKALWTSSQAARRLGRLFESYGSMRPAMWLLLQLAVALELHADDAWAIDLRSQ